MKILESRPEMGAPYPQERGGAPRVLSGPHGKSLPDDHRVVHPSWPPPAPVALGPRTVQAARDLDRALNLYLNAPRAATGA
jgi:hypothetical protein